MSTDRIPAEAFSVWSFIEDELEARGWTREQLAVRMLPHGIDPDEAEKQATIWLCALDLLEHVPDKVCVGVRDSEALARAFGVSPKLFLNLDRLYRAWLKQREAKA